MEHTERLCKPKQSRANLSLADQKPCPANQLPAKPETFSSTGHPKTQRSRFKDSQRQERSFEEIKPGRFNPKVGKTNSRKKTTKENR
jgi:hypothetical protein